MAGKLVPIIEKILLSVFLSSQVSPTLVKLRECTNHGLSQLHFLMMSSAPLHPHT